MNIWDEIYEKGEWGEGSGSGSTVETTKRYVEVVNETIGSRHGQVLDLGCGIWNKWQEYLKPNGKVAYAGVDASSIAIARNRFLAKNENFIHLNFFCDGVYEYLGRSNYANDFILLKDVLQHNSNASVWKILSKLIWCKALIVTNDSVLDGVNRDCEDGGYRPIDLRLPPFNLKPTRVVDYPSSPHQKTILIFEK